LWTAYKPGFPPAIEPGCTNIFSFGDFILPPLR